LLTPQRLDRQADLKAAESDSFGASGLGMKRPGIQRYFKRQALLTNTQAPADLTESGIRAG